MDKDRQSEPDCRSEANTMLRNMRDGVEALAWPSMGHWGTCPHRLPTV